MTGFEWLLLVIPVFAVLSFIYAVRHPLPDEQEDPHPYDWNVDGY